MKDNGDATHSESRHHATCAKKAIERDVRPRNSASMQQKRQKTQQKHIKAHNRRGQRENKQGCS